MVFFEISEVGRFSLRQTHMIMNYPDLDQGGGLKTGNNCLHTYIHNTCTSYMDLDLHMHAQ